MGEPAVHGGVEGCERDFALISDQIERLRALAADERAAADGDQRYDLSIRWGVLMSGRLRRLLHYDSTGEFSADEQRRFDDLAAELRAVAPLAARLGMADPEAALNDAARG